MATVASALQRVKLHLHNYVPASLIEATCRDAGHVWRKRIFDPVFTIQLFVLQILHCNTAITHLRHLAGGKVNPSAYCQARMRLPVAVLQMLLQQVAQSFLGINDQRLWCGLRVYLADASCAIAPDTHDNQQRFPQPKGQREGCGFPIPSFWASLTRCPESSSR